MREMFTKTAIMTFFFLMNFFLLSEGINSNSLPGALISGSFNHQKFLKEVTHGYVKEGKDYIGAE